VPALAVGTGPRLRRLHARVQGGHPAPAKARAPSRRWRPGHGGQPRSLARGIEAFVTAKGPTTASRMSARNQSRAGTETARHGDRCPRLRRGHRQWDDTACGLAIGPSLNAGQSPGMVATGVREPVEALGLGMAYLVISRDLCQCTWHRRDDEAATETTGEDPREAARTGISGSFRLEEAFLRIIAFGSICATHPQVCHGKPFVIETMEKRYQCTERVPDFRAPGVRSCTCALRATAVVILALAQRTQGGTVPMEKTPRRLTLSPDAMPGRVPEPCG